MTAREVFEKQSAIYLLLILSFFTRYIHAHVALVFPPARKYDLDFLDNVRTQGGCGGMPKGNIVTTIPNGQKLRVDWHLGYAHGGGFRLELLNENGNVDLDFTNGFIATDKYAQSYEIDIPDTLTSKGILRLTRQAKEWKNYEFYSCADVEIVPVSDYQTDCLGHGASTGSSCKCDRFRFGDRCQYFQDCVDDSDCQNGGRCIENPGTALPKKECYCPMGFFGKNCDKKSDIASKSYNESMYNVVELRRNKMKFLWRLMGQFEDTVEGIIVAQTNSYAAVGWRDKNESPQCQKFPMDVGHPFIPKNLHPMDCQDIIIGKANGDFSNIGDYYTRDRSTPRRDDFYGGEENLSSAAGWEEDGTTTIIFRKPVDSPDMTDNKFESEIELIWATGQNGQDFYKNDELKYHGGNRGKKTIIGKNVSAAASASISFASILLVGLTYFFVL